MKLDQKVASKVVSNYLEFREYIASVIGSYNDRTDIPVQLNETTITTLYRLYTDIQKGLWR